jgi:hypothetical protein
VANLRGRWIDVAAIEVAESLMNVIESTPVASVPFLRPRARSENRWLAARPEGSSRFAR